MNILIEMGLQKLLDQLIDVGGVEAIGNLEYKGKKYSVRIKEL